MKLLGKLTKEHIQGTNRYSRLRERSAPPDVNAGHLPYIGVSHLGEQRKVLLATLIPIDREIKERITLPVCVLDIARDWALHRQESYPTMKEKASVLQKMATFETRGEPLVQCLFGTHSGNIHGAIPSSQ